ncbi:hypothetical protein Tco_1284886 [Tanacetum coccineum]
MEKSSSQNPSSPNLTPKQEHVTLNKPNSPNLFLPADQVEFTFDEMLFTTNNEESIYQCPNLIFWYTAKALENSRIWVLTLTGGIMGVEIVDGIDYSVFRSAHTTSRANDESRANDISQKVKLEDFSNILKDTRSTFFTPDSPTNEPIIVSDKSEEEEDAEKDKDAEDTSVPPPLFSTMMDNVSGATSMHVPSAGQAAASPAEGEKNTKDAGTNLKEELNNLLGKDVVIQYYTKKLLFDKYCDKILKRKKIPKITNYEVVTKKALSH